MNKKIQERIKELLAALNKDIFEKEEAIRLTLLTAIAGESIFLLGRPGVAKSLIARRLKFAFKDAHSFEYLMNRFSTPDEIFGPISIKKLKDEDKYERLTEKYLPQAHVAFLDEIWKAGPSIQNALLTIINEKVYRNGEKEVPANLQALIAASNELPEKEQGLEALWDRFLVRLMVTGVSDEKNFESLISKKLTSYDAKIAEDLVITTKEYKDWSEKIDDVTIPTEVFKVIHAIRKQIQQYSYNHHDDVYENEIYISDRRWRKIVRLLRTSAFLNGRREVDLMDCFLIAHCIWNEQEQINDMKDLVADVLKKHGYALSVSLKPIQHQIKEFEREIKEEIAKLNKPKVTYTQKTEKQKINNLYYEISGLNQSHNKIKISDFNNLTTQVKQIPLHTGINNGSSNKYAKKITENQIQLSTNKHNWSTYNFKMVKTQIPITTYHQQKPNPKLIKTWNQDVNNIKQLIQKEIKKVETYRNNQLAHLDTNLFVNNKLARHIDTNLHNIIKELQEMRTEVKKIKYGYETIK